MATPMKGLTQFIADLRAARSYEQEKSRIYEELRNVREKFSDQNINAYNKRKYVAKLIYIYVLGYQVDFGHQEALSLIKMSKFSEKQVGYLAIGLIMNEDEKVVDSAIPTVMADLASLDDINTCLALNFMSTVSTVYPKLSTEVFKLLVSPVSSNYVRKKAALVLLHVYKLDSSQIQVDWIDRIIAYIDSPSIGVALSVSGLVKALVIEDEYRCASAFTAAIGRLGTIFFQHQITTDYYYYKVPCPWLCVRLLEILQLFEPNFAKMQANQSEVLEINLKRTLVKVVETSISDIRQALASPDSGQQLNAANAVFFEAVNALEHHGLLESAPQVTEQIVATISSFIHNKNPTLRFLALNALLSLHRFKDIIQVDDVISQLRDKDISIKRKCVDLLFNISDASNIEHIAAELLDFLPLSDSQIRKDIITVLAAIIESHATNHRWYLDTSLSLLMVGGSSVSTQIWQRVVRFVVNNDDVQPYATKAVYEYLQQSHCSDNTLKVGAYILGEYGHLLSGTHTPEDQFLVLQDRASSADNSTANVLLTAYIKFAATYPELRPQIASALHQYICSSDLELHQRASEYYNMLRQDNQHLLTVLWEKMPSFDEEAASLLAPVARHKTTLTRQNTGIKRAARKRSMLATDSKASLVEEPSVSPAPVKSENYKDHMLSSNWEHGFRFLLTHNHGTLFQDALLQVGCQYEFDRCNGTVILQLCNLSKSIVLSSLSVEINNPMGDDVLSLSLKNIPSTTLRPQQITELVILCEARQPFAVVPTCRVRYVAGAYTELIFRLPVVVERFMSPAFLDANEFFHRWEQIGKDGEFQKVFKNFSNSKVKKIVDNDAEVLKGLNYGIVFGADANKRNIVGAAILHTSAAGNFGCLARIEPDANRENIRVTARATKKLISVVMTKNISNVYQL